MALKIAYFGQAPFGRDVLVRLLEAGHEIVGVYAPREGKRPDPLAEEALSRGLRLFRYGAMRRKGEPIAERVAEHAALGADLNVLAFVTMILPEAVVEAPLHGSLCFHPSLLPRFRGGNALAWQIIEGESEAGVTVFRSDAGVDTGPIVVQKGGVAIERHHTAASLYFEQLYELGVLAMVEAVDLVDSGKAEYRPQDESLASFQGLLDDDVAAIDWGRSATELDCLMRGCDPAPGAHTTLAGEEIRLFGVTATVGSGTPGEIVGHDDGAALVAATGGALRVERVRLAGKGKQPAAEVLEIGARLG
ncbi:MAG: methionyl-tRNA formyltransferase [bacterium]|nr:methionyl-tRNA formyltransferase [bacterium]